MMGCREKKRIRPVGASAIWKKKQMHQPQKGEHSSRRWVDVQQRPHGEVGVDQAAPEIESAWETGGDFEVGVESDGVTGSRGRLRDIGKVCGCTSF
jgi:hypothetical protein